MSNGYCYGQPVRNLVRGASYGVSNAAQGARYGLSRAAQGVRYGTARAAQGVRYGVARAAQGLGQVVHNVGHATFHGSRRILQAGRNTAIQVGQFATSRPVQRFFQNRQPVRRFFRGGYSY